jgi:hypothetical protein
MHCLPLTALDVHTRADDEDEDLDDEDDYDDEGGEFDEEDDEEGDDEEEEPETWQVNGRTSAEKSRRFA